MAIAISEPEVSSTIANLALLNSDLPNMLKQLTSCSDYLLRDTRIFLHEMSALRVINVGCVETIVQIDLKFPNLCSRWLVERISTIRCEISQILLDSYHEK